MHVRQAGRQAGTVFPACRSRRALFHQFSAAAFYEAEKKQCPGSWELEFRIRVACSRERRARATVPLSVLSVPALSVFFWGGRGKEIWIGFVLLDRRFVWESLEGEEVQSGPPHCLPACLSPLGMEGDRSMSRAKWGNFRNVRKNEGREERNKW